MMIELRKIREKRGLTLEMVGYLAGVDAALSRGSKTASLSRDPKRWSASPRLSVCRLIDSPVRNQHETAHLRVACGSPLLPVAAHRVDLPLRGAETAMSATLTIPEVAALLGVSRNTAYEEARSGEIAGVPVISVGRRLLVPRKPLLELLGEDEGPFEADPFTVVDTAKHRHEPE